MVGGDLGWKNHMAPTWHPRKWLGWKSRGRWSQWDPDPSCRLHFVPGVVDGYREAILIFLGFRFWKTTVANKVSAPRTTSVRWSCSKIVSVATCSISTTRSRFRLWSTTTEAFNGRNCGRRIRKLEKPLLNSSSFNSAFPCERRTKRTKGWVKW